MTPADAAAAPPVSVRSLSLAVLADHRASGRFAEDVLDSALAAAAMAPRDRGLARELVLGTIRHRATLDAVAAVFSNRPLAQVEPEVLDAVRIGLYQLTFLERIPPFAAVGETVEALRSRGKPAAIGFVNGILRSVLRDLDGRRPQPADPRRDVPLGPGRYMAFRRPVLPDPSDAAVFLAAAHSYPIALVRRWLQRHGRDRTEALLAAGNQPPPVVLRANRRRIARDALVARLIADGIAAQPAAHPSAVVLDKPGRPLVEMPAFAEGLATAQDVTAIEVGEALEPQPGEMVLDLCAAPGGKSTHLAELMDDRGLVLAGDVSDEKLAMIAAGAARLGLTMIRTVRADRLDETVSAEGAFDRALADVPCSNTGVLSRRAEARWRFRGEDLGPLSLQQLALLRQAGRAVRPGGLLVYSTCSIEPEENQRVVEAFLDGRPGFRLRDQTLTLPEAGPSAAGWRDGGFRARLERVG